MTRKEYADSMRKIVDFFESHEEIRSSIRCRRFRYLYRATGWRWNSWRGRSDSFKKHVDENRLRFLELHKQFGTTSLPRHRQSRGRVPASCSGKEVWFLTTLVPEHVVPEREVEIVEWHCPDSLLRRQRHELHQAIVRRAQMGWRFTAQVDTQALLWLEARGNRHVRRDSAWHFLCLDGASTGRGESRGSRAADLAGDTVTGGPR